MVAFPVDKQVELLRRADRTETVFGSSATLLCVRKCMGDLEAHGGRVKVMEACASAPAQHMMMILPFLYDWHINQLSVDELGKHTVHSAKGRLLDFFPLLATRI